MHRADRLAESSRVFLICLAIGATALSCKGSARDERGQHPEPARPSNSTTPDSGTLASASSVEARGADKSPVEAARRMLDAWNAALNAHDVDGLRKLYAPSIAFYGREMPRERVLAAKRAAFAAAPAFTQALSAIQIAPAPTGGVSVIFDKDSGSAARRTQVQGKLVIDERDGRQAIVVESDEPSDARASAQESCAGTAMKVASALSEVKKTWREAGSDARQGGVVYSEDGANLSASLGFDHDDHFESVFGIEVRNGELTVSEYDTPLQVSAADLAAVKAACLGH